MVAARADLVFAKVKGKTTPIRISFRYPLRFLVPTKLDGDSRVDSCWVYTLNYGGGLVAGDQVHVTCDVGAECTAVLTTQGSTKIYKMRPHLGASSARSGVTRQTLTATVAPSATLALLPDFLTCFRGADYEQSQEIRMLRGGNLVLVDWYTSGRMGRGESWVFHRLSSNTRVYMDGQLLLWEPLLLEGGKGEGATCSKPSSASASSSSSRLTALATRMGSYHCFCLLVLIGPRLADLIQQVSRSQGRPTFQAWERGAAGPAEHRAQSLGDSACVSSLCHLIDGTQGKKGQGLALKIAGKATEDVRQLLKSFLAPLASVVGTEPYSGM